MEANEFSVAAGALHPHLLPSEMSLEGRRRRKKDLMDRGKLIAKMDKFGAVDWNSYWPVLV